jgi:hypothetical protein
MWETLKIRLLGTLFVLSCMIAGALLLGAAGLMVGFCASVLVAWVYIALTSEDLRHPNGRERD